MRESRKWQASCHLVFISVSLVCKVIRVLIHTELFSKNCVLNLTILEGGIGFSILGG
jgi:hypothetical protein